MNYIEDDNFLIDNMPKQFIYQNSYGTGWCFTAFYFDGFWYVHCPGFGSKKHFFKGPYSKADSFEYARKRALESAQA